MKRLVVKRSVVLAGHKTSVSIEDQFWDCLKSLAARESRSVTDIVEVVDAERPIGSNLSSALRLYVLNEIMKNGGGR